VSRPLASRLAPLALLLALLAPACIVIDVRANHEGSGFEGVGLIDGYATAGWPADDSLLKLGLLEGRSDGTLLMLQVWKLLRVELGLVGFTLGVGPLDLGVGTLFFDPEAPRYCYECDDCGSDACAGECQEPPAAAPTPGA